MFDRERLIRLIILKLTHGYLCIVTVSICSKYRFLIGNSEVQYDKD